MSRQYIRQVSRSLRSGFWDTLRSLWFFRFLGCFTSVESDELFSSPNDELISQYDNNLQEKQLWNDFDLAYNMQHKKRGVAVIFNQNVFIASERKKRNGSDRDRNRLQDALQQNLQFDVRISQDRKFEEIIYELKQVAKEDHSNNDCLLIAFMTHGTGEALASYNRDFELESVIDIFSDARCPTLKGKPRIFLIQSCRGDKEPKEINETLHYENNCVREDFLIVRSTMPGCKSYRDPDNGSWFIQQFCTQVEMNKKKRIDLMQLLHHVNAAVNNISANDTANNSQTVSISSESRKAIIFTRKLSEFERVKRKVIKAFKSKSNILSGIKNVE